MLDAHLRERLRQLRQQPPPLPRPQLKPVVACPLHQGSERTTSVGPCWEIRRSVRQLWSEGGRVLAQFGDQSGLPSQPELHPDLQRLSEALPCDALFLDLETCGLAGSGIFLTGLLHWHAGELVLTQLLARDYSEERGMLCALWEIAGGCRLLVTFNGKSFDWPMVRDRTVRFRFAGHLGQEQPLPHCDLLHHSRRRWRDRLPNCRLQTLERFVCGRHRQDDIPGHVIPQAYHRFVQTGDAWEMRSILHHNALDLITLLDLALRILRLPGN